MDKPKLGSPVKADIKRNCLLCSRWTVCRDPNKDMDYACSKFTNQFEQSMHDLFEQEYEEEKKEQRFLKKNKEKLSSKEVRSRFNSKINITSEHVKNDSIFDLIMETINSGSPLPPDLKINDKDIRKPPNVLEWMIEPEFIGGDQKPFAKQIQIAVHTMGEWCPKCSNEEYFECVPVDASVDDIKSEVIFLKNGKCPRCKSTKYDLVQDEYLIDPFEIIGILGQRSGKSILSTMMESYNTARWVLTPNLPATFRVLQSSVFTSSYTATTFGQAKGAFWDPLNAIFLDSEWFKTYHKFLNEEGNKLGEELYKHSETMLTYRHKNIVLAPASPSMRSLRGRCVIGSTIVNTNDGFIHFNELIKNNGYNKVNNTFIDSPSGNKKVSHFYKTKGKTIKITTRNGYSLEGTHEHPILVVTKNLDYKWRRLENIKIGDWIVSKTNKNKPIFGNNREINKYHAILLGYYIANGYRNEISSNDKDVAKRIAICARKLYNGTVKTKLGGDDRADSHILSGSSRKAKAYNKWTFKSKFITPYVDCHNSHDKEIPLAIRTAPKEILHAFLEAYFECDCGYNGVGEIDISSSSEKLIDQIQIILQQVYGIIGRKFSFKVDKNAYRKARDKKHNFYILNLTGYDSIMFLNYFKRAKVQKYKHRYSVIPAGKGSDRRVIPYIKNFIWDIFRKSYVIDPNHKRLYFLKTFEGDIVKISGNKPKCIKNMRPSHNNTRNRDKSPEYLVYNDNWNKKLQFIKKLDPIKAKKLTKFLNLRANYEEVVSIEAYSKLKKVYDVTVPEGHCFTANGLGSHNTRITGVIDELGWFQTGKNKKGEDFERMNAKEVYIAIKRSLSTMRASYIKRFNQGYYQLPKPLLTLISSPKARNDQIMTRYREAEGSREVYRIKAPTWEANPEQTREVLSEEFRTDYVGAMRDYGCEPPMAANAWITDENLIEGAFTGPKNAITVTTRRFRTKSNKLATAGYYKTRRIPTYPNNGGAILGIDAGFSNNSFAFAVGYPTSIPDPEDEEEEDVIVGMNIALVGEIIPRKDYPISFTAVYKQLLQPLCSEFNVAVVISDTWQNKKLQQDLEDSLGISYFEYKLGLQEFIDYREGIYENIIQHPKLDMPFEDISSMTLEDYPNCFNKFPVAHLAFQMMTVQNTGTAIIKGEEGTTDDILRACVICHAGLQNEEVLDEVLSFSTATQPIQALGTVALASSGRSSNHSGMGSQNTSNIGVTASYGGSSRPATGNSSSSIGILGRK